MSRTSLVLRLPIAIALAALASSAGLAASQELPSKVPALVGTWRVTFDRPPGPRGTALVTFTSDGTSVRTTDRHAVMSPSHGAWKQVGEREFQATWHAFQLDDKGNYVGNQQASFRVVFGTDPNRFTGMARGTAHAFDGTLRGTVVGPFEGARVVVEPYVD